MPIERLQKILSNAGVASRRSAELLILEGRVAVNGVKQTTLGARADPETDEITLDGVPVDRGRYRYFALNKPAGFVTTASDDQERETVLDLVPIGDVQLHPVGRLDMDSEGLLILTNDGHLTDLLTHPRYEVSKDYLVGLDAAPSKHDLERLVRGIESDGERLRAATAQPARPPAGGLDETPEAPAWLMITLKEGKNREIRRMMGAIGREVILLRRIRVGPLHLGTLSLGAFRELSEDEVTRLYAAVKTRSSEPAPKSRILSPAAPNPFVRRPAGPPKPAQPARTRFSAAPPPGSGPTSPSAAQRAGSGRPGAQPRAGAGRPAQRTQSGPPRTPPAPRTRFAVGQAPTAPPARSDEPAGGRRTGDEPRPPRTPVPRRPVRDSAAPASRGPRPTSSGAPRRSPESREPAPGPAKPAPRVNTPRRRPTGTAKPGSPRKSR